MDVTFKDTAFLKSFRRLKSCYTSLCGNIIFHGPFGTMVISSTIGLSPMGLTADYKPVADALLKSGVIPIMILHAKYHKFIAFSTALGNDSSDVIISFKSDKANV